MPDFVLLLLSPDRDFRYTLDDHLQLRAGMNVVRAESVERARELPARDYHAVIYAPSPDETRRETEEILDYIDEAHAGAEIILVLANQNSKLEDAIAARAGMPITVLQQGLNFMPRLTSTLDRLQNHVPLSNQRLYLTIAVKNSKEWRWNIAEGNPGPPGRGVLAVDENLIEAFEKRSVELYNQMSSDPPGDWLEVMQKLGSDMREQIFEANETFWTVFKMRMRLLRNNYRKLKVNFQISDDAPTLVYESIFRNDDPEGFWMVEAAVYRSTLDYTGNSKPLIFGRERRGDDKLNCLFIESDAFGPVEVAPGIRGELEKLQFNECSAISNHLLVNKEHFGLGRILVVRKNMVRGCGFREFLEDVLEGEVKWHIVHYSGHSLYCPATGRGYLFFPKSSTSSEPVAVDIATFATGLADAGFIYLSSCQSETGTFTRPLTNLGVPSLIGFGSPVRDVHAAQFAKAFYSALFGDPKAPRSAVKEQSLERAIAEVRSTFSSGKYPPIWAQAILLKEWEPRWI